jgi:DNA-binding beta-propeller fold protein YncE
MTLHHLTFSRRCLTGIAALMLMSLFGGTPLLGLAQEDILNVEQVAQYNLGFGCPASVALDSAGSTVWVLMDNCSSGRYSLHGYDAADGTPATTPDFGDLLGEMDTAYLDWFTVPLGFLPDGILDIRYIESENYTVHNLHVQVDSGEVEQPPAEGFNELVAGLTDYPETTVFNADHTQAVVIGEASLHVIDIEAQSEVFSLNLEAESYSFFPSLSPNSRRLYVAQLTNPDDLSDYTSELSVYSLPDGSLLQTRTIPSPFIWASPDGHYAAALIGDNEGGQDNVVVIDLENGSTSQLLPMFEPRQKVMTCANNGNDMSDTDLTATGLLALRGLVWLPDSTGFMTVNSYLGDGIQGGGTFCAFNYSRLRHYAIQPES